MNTSAVVGFLQDCARRMALRADCPQAAHAAGLLQHALADPEALDFEASWLPALDTIGSLDASPLGSEFAAVARQLPWSPTTRVADDGDDFAFAEINRVLDLGDLTVGLMYVRPGRQYPLHHHPPHEVYLTLAGTASWRYGGDDGFRTVGSDTTIYNHPNDLHSVIAGDTPMVALYVLWE